MSFALDAGLFVHQLDLASDRALLMAMSGAHYRAASFIKGRVSNPHDKATKNFQMHDEWLQQSLSPRHCSAIGIT